MSCFSWVCGAMLSVLSRLIDYRTIGNPASDLSLVHRPTLFLINNSSFWSSSSRRSCCCLLLVIKHMSKNMQDSFSSSHVALNGFNDLIWGAIKNGRNRARRFKFEIFDFLERSWRLTSLGPTARELCVHGARLIRASANSWREG